MDLNSITATLFCNIYLFLDNNFKNKFGFEIIAESFLTNLYFEKIMINRLVFSAKNYFIQIIEYVKYNFCVPR